jgi:hypothetical protein
MSMKRGGGGLVSAWLRLACVLGHRPSPDDRGANADRRPDHRGRRLRTCCLDELAERARSARRAMTRAPPFRVDCGRGPSRPLCRICRSWSCLPHLRAFGGERDAGARVPTAALGRELSHDRPRSRTFINWPVTPTSGIVHFKEVRCLDRLAGWAKRERLHLQSIGVPQAILMRAPYKGRSLSHALAGFGVRNIGTYRRA